MSAYTLETTWKRQPKIYPNILAFAMRQRRSGTELVYRSNARFLYQSQSFLPVESIETFNTETLMASTQDRTFNILVSECYLRRISLLIISQHEIRSFLRSIEFFPTFNATEISVWFLCIRLQQSSIESAMDLTDSFTWEDLPTRDADTGHLTAAGWIPLIMKYNKSAAISMLCFHTIQSTFRMATNHETIFRVWYPFDWTVSPFYELVNIAQVTVSEIKFSYIRSQGILI